MWSRLTVRWLPPVALACVAVIEAAVFASQGDIAAAVVSAGLLLAFAWWLWPWRGRASASHQVARERHARDGVLVIYWRPGCTFCARLRLRLGRAGRKAFWINVWSDDEALEFVRHVNGVFRVADRDGAEGAPQLHALVRSGVAVAARTPLHVSRALVSHPP